MAQYQTLYNCILMFVYLRAPWTNVWNIFAVQYVCESFGWIKQKPQALKLSIFFLCLAFRICNGTLNSFQSISTIGLNVVDFQFICVECTKSAFDKIHFPLPLEVIISTKNKNVVVWFLFMQKWLTFSPNQKVLSQTSKHDES